MAIGKINKGSGFGGVCSYALAPDKKPRVLSHCGVGENLHPRAVARAFRRVSNLRPTVTKPVRHLSISFAPEDGLVSDDIKNAIVERVLRDLGYQNCQYIAIDHDRADPGDATHDHDHLHIITNAVDFFGNYVRDSWERYKIQSSLRDVELEFGLKQISSSWEVKREKAKSINLDRDIAKLVADSLVNCSDLRNWLDRLERVNINVRFNLTHPGIARGVTYLKNGEIYQGRDIGASWPRVSEQLTQGADDLKLMKAANLKSQEKTVQLSQHDRAMCDRVVEMAVMKLGQGKQFKNSRADIKLEGDTLTVIRIRPHKLMVKAAQTNKGWEPVGFPNIQKKDVELLERMNGVEAKKFESSSQRNVREMTLDESIGGDAVVVSNYDDQEEDDYEEDEGLCL